MFEACSAGNAPLRRPDLAAQLRSLALCRALSELEADKNRRVRDGSRMFEGIDAQYLGLALIDWMMAESFFSQGVERDAAVAHVAELAREMKPDLAVPDAGRIGEEVFDALSNGGRNNQQAFRVEYWDAAERRTAIHEFRLLRYTQFDDERFLWEVTRDGLLLHLGMLSMPADIAGELERKMLTRLLAEGRVEDAARMADRARVEAQIFRRDLEQGIFLAARGTRVDWAGAIVPRIGTARRAVLARIGLDADILDALKAALPDAAEADRPALLRVKSLVEACQRVHTELDSRLNTASREFRQHQSSQFALRLPGAEVDPQEGLLVPMLAAPMASIAAEADEIARLLSAPVVRRLSTLSDVIGAAEESWITPCRAAEDGSEDSITAVVPPRDSFPAEMTADLAAWLGEALAERGQLAIDEALALAEVAGRTRLERRLLALQGVNLFTGGLVDVAVSGQFQRPEAAGDRLLYRLKSPAVAAPERDAQTPPQEMAA